MSLPEMCWAINEWTAWGERMGGASMGAGTDVSQTAFALMPATLAVNRPPRDEGLDDVRTHPDTLLLLLLLLLPVAGQ